jgi:flavin reductase (DIM6/NTAB) family NADH-FMN oxidoreductase RutF
VNVTDVSTLFAALDPPLWLLTARDASRRGGLIATFVNQASIVPDLPRVLVGLARQHYTHELVEASGAFALHLLGERHLDLVWLFGLQSGRVSDKLLGLAYSEKATGSPVLADVLGWLDCRVESRLDTGDRTVYLAEVLDGGMTGPDPVLTIQRMLNLAPSDKLRQLKESVARDGQVDEAAIRSWRRSRP